MPENEKTPIEKAGNLAIQQQLQNMASKYKPYAPTVSANGEISSPVDDQIQQAANAPEVKAKAEAQAAMQSVVDKANIPGIIAKQEQKQQEVAGTAPTDPWTVALDNDLKAYNNAVQEDENAKRYDTARRTIGGIADAISGFANLYGTTKGSTPLQLNPATSMINENIIAEGKRRSANIQALRNNLNTMLDKLNARRKQDTADFRAQVYAQNANTRQADLERKINEFAQTYGLKRENLDLDWAKLEQKIKSEDRNFDFKNEHEQNAIIQKVADRELKQQLQQAKDAEKAKKDAEKKAGEAQKARDKKIKELGSSITEFDKAKKAAIAAGAKEDDVAALAVASEDNVRKLMALSPKWAASEGLADATDKPDNKGVKIDIDNLSGAGDKAGKDGEAWKIFN